MFDCEVVIDEKENAERGRQEIEGLAVKILFNAVTINQNLVYHFTSDKKVNHFVLCFELFTTNILIYISLTVYIGHAVVDETVTVGYSAELSVFLSRYSRRIAMPSRVRDDDYVILSSYYHQVVII